MGIQKLASRATSMPTPAEWEATVDNPFVVCTADDDRSRWNSQAAALFDHWLGLRQNGRLPGRKCLDPLDIPGLLPRMFLLDVHRDPLRFRYRLVGTQEVSALGREVTGCFFDEVHPSSLGRTRLLAAFGDIVANRCALHRRGRVRLLRDKQFMFVENCLVPFAQDGETVDMIVGLNVFWTRTGGQV